MASGNSGAAGVPVAGQARSAGMFQYAVMRAIQKKKKKKNAAGVAETAC